MEKIEEIKQMRKLDDQPEELFCLGKNVNTIKLSHLK